MGSNSQIGIVRSADEPPSAVTGLTLDRDDLDTALSATRDSVKGQRGYAMLYGPPGTGKTTSAIASAAPGQEVIVYTLRAEASAVEFTGHKEIQGGNTVYWEGLGIQAWRRGALLVLNEVNNASEDVMNYLYQLLDDQNVAQMRLPAGEVVRPKAGFRVISTMNGLPSELPEAIRDRHGLWFEVEEPSTEMYARLDPDVREVVRSEYERCAEAHNARDKIPYVSFREAMAFCEIRRTGIFASERDCARLALSGDRDSGVDQFMAQLESSRGSSRDTGMSRSTLLQSQL